MKTYLEQQYYEALDKLFKIAHEIEPWYDIDKVKDYAVYIWTKGEYGENVFDILADKLIFYTQHEVIPEAVPTILRIQEQLKEIRKICKQLRKEV